MSIARTLRNHNPVFTFQRPLKTLDRVNELLEKEHRTLHPTKGFRKISVKRTLIDGITYRMKRGEQGFDTLRIRKILNREIFI